MAVVACTAMFTAMLAALPESRAGATTLVSNDCDLGGVNVNDGTISGTYLKIKTKVANTGGLWVCYRIDRDTDPVIHEGGKLTFGTSSPPVQDTYAGYCATRPNNTIDVDANVGPDSVPTLLHRLSPPSNLEELGICIRVGTVLFRASAIVKPNADNKIERDAVTCSQVVGKVTNQLGDPVSGATIRQVGDGVDACASAALTDSAGEYSLLARVAVPTQTVTIRSERTGYQTQELTVPIGDPTNTLADFELFADATTWTDAGCQEDGNPLLNATVCKPLSAVGVDPTAPVGSVCEDAIQCDKSLDDLKLALSPEHLSVLEQIEAIAQSEDLQRTTPIAMASAQSSQRASAAPTPQDWSSVHFYFLRDTPGTSNCTDWRALVYNGNCGYLDYLWTSHDSTGRAVSYHTIYGARSGDNKPGDDCIVKRGPINASTFKTSDPSGSLGKYRVGYRYNQYTGFRQVDESHPPMDRDYTYESFKPGQFDLDPWSVPCTPKARGAFQIHGGVNSHQYWNRDHAFTQGCIRITEGSVNAVWRRWIGAPNKSDFPLHVIYRPDTYA